MPKIIYPWGLTNREVDAINAVTNHGLGKLAAAALGTKYTTLACHLDRARRKAGVQTTLQLAVKFDRHMRGTQ